MKFLYLTLAILFEVMGTTSMKLAEGFTKPLYSVLIFVFYIGSLAFLTLSLKFFEISAVYAIWSGVGISLIALIGVMHFSESLTPMKIAFLLLIGVGVVGLNLSGIKK